MNNNKGITLVELIIAISIASIMMATGYLMFGVGLESHTVVTEEFNQQSTIRYSIETINKALRFSTVGFAVTEDDFQPVENGNDVDGLVKPWSYLGLSPDKDAFVHYKWVDDGSTEGIYDMEILAEAPENVTYEMIFSRVSDIDENNLLKYNLKGTRNSEEMFSIETELEALNAIQIIDWGDAAKRSVAFAYRTEETPEISERPVAALGMVIDESGSMDLAMDGSSSYTNLDGTNPQRVSLLKDTLNKDDGGLFSILEESESYVSLIPFSTNANDPGIFYKVKTDKDTLKSDVNDLNPNGMTNTGDGIRRAYYKLFDFNNNPPSEIDSNQEIKNYMVVLVDGNTNTATVEGEWRLFWWWWSFNEDSPLNYYLGDGDIVHENDYGNTSDARKPYVEVIGDMVTNSNNLNIAKYFVIGYSNRSSDLEGIKEIAEALDITVNTDDPTEQYINNDSVFIATDKESLTEAFNIIGNYINEDLWQVSGPKLNP
ncbi:MAG: vWA domain-containing protein [Bacillota bacterium]|nr:vWA domain-containing protein [Bacillota bacterium]